MSIKIKAASRFLIFASLSCLNWEVCIFGWKSDTIHCVKISKDINFGVIWVLNSQFVLLFYSLKFMLIILCHSSTIWSRKFPVRPPSIKQTALFTSSTSSSATFHEFYRASRDQFSVISRNHKIACLWIWIDMLIFRSLKHNINY